MKHFLKKSALAAAAVASFGAQAVVVTFDQPITNNIAPDAPLYGHNSEFLTQGFYFDPYSNLPSRVDGDLVGALVDGADTAGVCTLVTCPGNPTGTFYSMLNDGYLIIGSTAGLALQLKGFSASFIGASGEAIPAVAALLRISSVSAANVTLVTQDFQLAGPNASGALSFASFTTNAAMGASNASFFRLRVAACNAAGSCSFTSTNLGQAALDNLDISVVPEPSQWALFGLGLAGIAALSRRRSV